VLRFVLLAVPVLCIVGPLFLPAADRTNPVRMLLLPIARPTMYVAQSATAFGDPWILLLLPVVLGLPLGLVSGGATGAAALALVAGALLVVAVVGISSLATSLLHLAVRDRRRGELLALILVIFIPLVSMLPGLMSGVRRPHDAQGRRLPRPAAERMVPAWAERAGDRAFAIVPTELYIRSTREAVQPNAVAALAPVAVLGAVAVVLHALGMVVFGRVLDSPGSTGARRSTPMRAAWGRRLPLLSTPASAVALAQVRLALRTTRGRSVLLSPVLFLAVFGVVMYRGGGGMNFGPFNFQSGLALAAFMSFISLISILPIGMNQFAVDKAGLTLALLSPLTDRDYLAGKAVGNGLIIAIPAAVCLLWVCIPLAFLAIALLVSPVAAMLSAIFPRVVDMNSIGRGSNAHGLAGFLGLVSYVAASLPCAALMLLAARWLNRPSLAPVFLLIWCVVAYGISRLLFSLARKVFQQRRENLALIL
jgi:hypothetical protein